MLRLFFFCALPPAYRMLAGICAASPQGDYGPKAAVRIDEIDTLPATAALRYTLSQKFPFTVNLQRGKER